MSLTKIQEPPEKGLILLVGPPGAGKSTTAAGVFSLLKLHGVNCELVTEYAKDLTWDKSFGVLSNQHKVTAEQYHRLWRLKEVDYVITDSPLLTGCLYTECPHIDKHIHDLFHEFNNVNYLLSRRKEYVTLGRNQTEEEALRLDSELKDVLELELYTIIPGDVSGIGTIVGDILDWEVDYEIMAI